MDNELKTATTTPETPPAAAPAPNPEPAKPIEMAQKPANKVTMMVAGILLLLVIAAGVYAYSSGTFNQSSAPAATTNTAGGEATTSDEIQALDATATQVGADLTDINTSSNDLDNIDLSSDEAPAL